MAEKTKLIIGIILFNMVICYANAQTDSLATKIDSLEKVYNLEGVTVTAHKRIFTQKPDRLIFNVENKENDELATDNEEIATSEVTVIAQQGAVRVANAAGKKVVVTNILGQTVANTVITSSDATIAAPQGVVVVAVEGEEAVKAIVK